MHGYIDLGDTILFLQMQLILWDHKEDKCQISCYRIKRFPEPLARLQKVSMMRFDPHTDFQLYLSKTMMTSELGSSNKDKGLYR